MEDLMESMQAIGIGTAAYAVSHADLSRSSLGPLHARLNAGRFGSVSLVKCIMETRRAVDEIMKADDAAQMELVELCRVSSEENDFHFFTQHFNIVLPTFDMINVDDALAGQSLEDELRKMGDARAIHFSPTIIEWLKSTSDRIMSTLMPAREFTSLKDDKARDFWLLITAMLSMLPITTKYVQASQEQEGMPLNQVKGSAKMMEVINILHAAFFEMFMKKMTDVMPPKDYEAWFATLRNLIANSKDKNVNRARDMRSWFMDDKGVEAYQDNVRTMIFTGLGLLHTNDDCSINTLQHRLNGPRLAEQLAPLVSKEDEGKAVEPWETELPFGDFLWSEKLPNGERLHFMANGLLDVSTIAMSQKDVHRSVVSEMSYVTPERPNFRLYHSISSSVRFGEEVCPGDMYGSIVPLTSDDPVRQTLFAADRTMRKKVNMMWCSNPALIALATTASPLCIAEDGDYTFVSCNKSGEKALSDIVGGKLDPVEVTEMAERTGIYIAHVTEDTVAFRIPTAALMLTGEHEVVIPTVNEDTSDTPLEVHQSPTVRAVLHSYLNGSGVKSYHDYIHALRRLGVKERQGNGSHIVLTTEGGGFTVHSHAFRSQGNNPINLGYVSRDLTQLHIEPEAFLDALSS